MKIKNILKYAAIAVAAGTSLTGVTSCNYLDVIPPEQAGLPDAMKDHDKALGFLYSCYAGLNNNALDGRCYFYGWINNSTDDYTLPEAWMDSEKYSFEFMRNAVSSGSTGNWEWGHFYKYIGQCLLFEEQLKTVGEANHVCNNEDEKKEWLAETQFLKAAYHFFMLRQYGPVPITTGLISMTAGLSDYPGRSHFDFCVDYICSELEQAAQVFEEQGIRTRTIEMDNGRACAMICKALIARVRLYAASPLWNGEYPYATSWKNTNFSTPGYGKDLVSSTFDPEKWVVAYNACEDALQYAETEGYYLWDQPTINSDTEVDPADIYVPVPEGSDPVSLEFKEKVSTMRYAVSTNETEGNRELIWSNRWNPTYWEMARVPKNVLTTAKGTTKSGWNGIAPNLSVVESFLTNAGTIPAEDEAAMGCTERDFYTKAGLTEAGREEVMRICLNREPRFYAWIAFHNGDYLTLLNNGKPKHLDFVDPAQQGRETGTQDRNYSATGFLSMKHVDPNITYVSTNETDGYSGGHDSPAVLIRMAELYLNVAECAAECSDRNITVPGAGDLRQRAIDMVNVIRSRAGAHELDDAVMATSSKSLVEWVRNERNIEFWNEGHRFFDVRRWAQANEYFGAGKRRGLKGADNSGLTFEQFAVPTNVDVQFRWHNRLYLCPLFINEVYKNPQMVQAPGF